MDNSLLNTVFSVSDNTIIICIGIGITLLLLAGIVLLLKKMNRIRKGYKENIAKRYNGTEILFHDNFAHYLGMEQFTGKQKRSTGVLILTHKELYFLRVQPRLELIIPLKHIKRVLTPSSFLGKTTGKPLLKIDYKDTSGTMNSVGWALQNVEACTKILKPQIKKTRAKSRK